MDTSFHPDGQRGRSIDTRVRQHLADSVDALLDAAAGHMRLDMDGLRALTTAVRTHPVRPGVMVLYADAVPALLEGDRTEAAAILSVLAQPAWREAATPRVVSVDDADLGPGMAARYRRHILDDPGMGIGFTVLDGAAMRQGRTRLADAFGLLAGCCPQLGAELGALVNEVVLVEGHAGPGSVVFHGASSFFVWGALVLNLPEHRTRVKLVEGLAHEAAHSLLHGLTLGGPLVTNDPAERHRSPLRDDARPMEGLVHAAYVLARMHLAMSALMEGRGMAVAEREEAGQRRAIAAEGFADSLKQIAAHACFTPAGAAIFAGAQAYMAEAAGVCRP